MTALETKVRAAWAKQFPADAKAIDFGSIIAILTTLMDLFKGCNFGRFKKSMQAGDLLAKVVAYKAVLKSGYDGDKVKFALDLVEEAKTATDEEINETYELAQSLPW